MTDTISIKATVDASDLMCPMPMLKAKQGLKALESGECLKVIATDYNSERDFRAFLQISGNRLMSFSKQNNAYIYVIQKA